MFTENKIEISERIKSGQTSFFNSIKEAKDYASSIRSYVYDVYDKNGNIIGYAVPK